MTTPTIAAQRSAFTSSRRQRLAGYAFGLCAGAIWGTTGPLSTALYAEGAQLTAVGFWRILLATAGYLVYGLAARDLFRIDGRGLLLVGVVVGLLVALFEVAFQFGIAGVGVAPAVALLYTAPVAVALLAHATLGEALTATRVALAVIVMVGVALTVNGTDVSSLPTPVGSTSPPQEGQAANTPSGYTLTSAVVLSGANVGITGLTIGTTLMPMVM